MDGEGQRLEMMEGWRKKNEGWMGWMDGEGERWRWWKAGGRRMKFGWVGWTEKGKVGHDGRLEEEK